MRDYTKRLNDLSKTVGFFPPCEIYDLRSTESVGLSIPTIRKGWFIIVWIVYRGVEREGVYTVQTPNGCTEMLGVDAVNDWIKSKK